MKKLFLAMLATETNTFSPLPTGWNVWRETLLRRRAEHDPTISRRQSVYAPLFARLDARGWALAPGLQAFAVPAGPTPRAVYESLRDELLDDLDAAMPCDAVMLFLHGAMVADGYDDCEGDILQRVRAKVGDRIPIGVELDLHCHVTKAMLDTADVLVGYKHYPHIDVYDRLVDLFEIVADTADGKVRPTMGSAACKMIGMYHTTREPMAGFVERMYALEREPGVLNVWLAHGFPYGDVPSIGAHVIVATDNDPTRARNLARTLRDEFFGMRDAVLTVQLGIDEALDLALQDGRAPITIADTADNTGGGAPGDSTFFLDALLRRRIGGAALGPLYDPVAVGICQDGGVGARLRLRIGGKLAPESGTPLDVDCTVIGLSNRVVQTLNGGPSSLGACAGVRMHIDGDAAAPGIEVTLTTRRAQAGSPELFTGVGIEPHAQRLLIVKSTQHFHAAFAPISARVIYTGDRGALIADPRDIPYRRVRTSDYWPFTAAPDFGD
jgi:microcystin degradation protein MlrC